MQEGYASRPESAFERRTGIARARSGMKARRQQAMGVDTSDKYLHG